MISSILRNLISNSIKFSNPGGEIDISVCRKDNKVIIIVGDNGVGIKKDVLTKLFRIEAKISTPGTLNEEGTGLGLILCKEFILKHSGEIRAESEHGSGSKFTVTLPVH
jgi:signal transduction histidine kinase